MTNILRCTCCQAEITMPQFYNGFPYGYTCITKIDPKFKRTKTTWIACDSFKLLSDPSLTTRLVYRVKVNGKVFDVVSYAPGNNVYEQNNILYVSDKHIPKK